MTAAALRDASFSDGFDCSGHQLQVLRNQRAGNMWITASSGPRLEIPISISMSVGEPLAYSTKTSKYRSSSNMPVSMSSYSGSRRLRPLLVFIRSTYGNSRCGYLYKYFMYE